MFKNRNRLLKYFIVMALMLDTVYTFKQNYGRPLDGDIVNIVLPGTNYAPVLKDPFGFHVLFKKESYPATNRFSCHVTMRTWYRQVYKVISFFFIDKVTALYVVTALFKTLVYLMGILILATYITGGFKVFSSE